MKTSEALVLALLYQLLVIIIASRLCAALARRFLGQTRVMGEILAGLLLGPSALGALFPDLARWLFTPETSTIFVALSQLGLVFLMFQVGLEFNFSQHLQAGKRAVALISLLGIVVPFALGALSAPWFHARLAEPRPSPLGFTLFFGTAMSITAVPVLGRIFIELGLAHTRTAAITIGAAAIDDVVGWLLLGVVSAIIATRFQLGAFALRIGGIAAYLALVFVVVRPIMLRAIARRMEKTGELGTGAIAAIVVALLASAAITSNLGVFAIIGGFALGVALHADRRFVAQWDHRMSPLVSTVLMPVFFTYTGLRTDLASLRVEDAWTGALVCAIAFAGKFGGAYVAARLAGEENRTALTIGVCMNTRGLMELVALNVGYDLGVLPRPMFSVLVVMAIVSTYLSTPLVRRLLAGEIRPAIGVDISADAG